MTKLRQPATFADAVTRVAGRIGWDACAEAVGKTDRAVRMWSDPDMDRAPTIADALALDAAFLAAGGGEPPLLAVYQLLLERRVTPPAGVAELARATAAAAKETGEAIAAAVSAVPASGCSVSRMMADREIGEAIEALTDLRNKLGAPSGNVTALRVGG